MGVCGCAQPRVLLFCYTPTCRQPATLLYTPHVVPLDPFPSFLCVVTRVSACLLVSHVTAAYAATCEGDICVCASRSTRAALSHACYAWLWCALCNHAPRAAMVVVPTAMGGVLVCCWRSVASVDVVAHRVFWPVDGLRLCAWCCSDIIGPCFLCPGDVPMQGAVC